MIIRELVNLISFKTDKQSVTKMNASFADVAKSAAKITAGFVTGMSAIGQKFYIDMESSISRAKFFGTQIDSIKKQLAEKKTGAIFSLKEMTQVKAGLSELAVSAEQLDEAMSFLKNITIAKGSKTSLKDTAMLLKEIIKSGDVDAIRKLGGITKELAEQLKRTSFSEAFKGGTEKYKMDAILKVLRANKDKIKKLADEQQNTLGVSLERMTTSMSDLSTKFGDRLAPSFKKAYDFTTAITDMLYKSEWLWDKIDSIIKAMDSIDLKSWITNPQKETEKIVGKVDSAIAPFVTPGSLLGGYDEFLTDFGNTIRTGANWLGGDFKPEKSLTEKYYGQETVPQNIKIDVSGDIKINGNDQSSVLDIDISNLIKKHISDIFTRTSNYFGDERGR